MKKVSRRRLLQKTIAMLLAVVTLLSVSVIAPGTGETVQAASKKSAALKAYKKVLGKSMIKVGKESFEKSRTSFAVKDISADGIPELILIKKGDSYGDSVLLISTYHKKKIKSVFSDMWRENSVYAYKKGGVFYIPGRQGAEWKNYYKIKNGKLKSVAYYENDAGKITCCIGKKNSSQSKFEKYIDKITQKSQAKKVTFNKVSTKNVKKI